MMQFSSLTDRIGGQSVDAWDTHYKAAARLNAGEDIYLLSVGQESYEYTDRRIVDAAIKSLEQGRHHYTPVEGELKLRQLIAQHHRAKTGQHVDENNCVVFSGAQNGLFATTLCLLQPGDEVIIPEPYYTTYPASFSLTGATLKAIPCHPKDQFQVSVERVLAAITPQTRMLVLNTPNNPTGTVYEKQRVAALVEACAERDIWLVSDDVYADLVEPDQFFSPASMPGADKVVVTVSSLSKSHRMTGWRLGWAVAPEALIRHFYNLNMCMNYGLVSFVQDAAMVALKYSDQITPTIRENINKRRNVLLEHLQAIAGLKVNPSQAGMFVMIDIKGLKTSGQDFCRHLLDQYDVSLTPCDGFGDSGAGLIRASACDSPERLKQACERIGKFVASLS